MAMSVGELTATLSMDTSNYSKGLTAAERAAKKWESQTVSSSKMATSAFSGVFAAAAALAVAFGAAAYKGISLAGDMEKTAGSFEVLLGSVDAAQKMMEDLQKFADTTPFEFPEVATAAKNLLALGLSAGKIPATMQALGDISAAVNIPFGELADIYGKINVQGRVFAEDINQLQGRGIPIIEEMAKQFGISKDQMVQMVSDGKIGFPEVEKALAALTGEGGKFHGMMDKLSKTLPGLMSTMMDTINKTLTIFGQKLIEVFNIKGAIESFSKALGDFNKQIKDVGLTMMILNNTSTAFKIALVLVTGAMIGLGSAAIVALGGIVVAGLAAIAPLLGIAAAGALITAMALNFYVSWSAGLTDIAALIKPFVTDFMNGWNMIGEGSSTTAGFIGDAFHDVFIGFSKGLKVTINNWYKLYTAAKNVADMLKSGNFSMEGLTKGFEFDFAGEMFASLTTENAKKAWEPVGNTLESLTAAAGEEMNKKFRRLLLSLMSTADAAKLTEVQMKFLKGETEATTTATEGQTTATNNQTKANEKLAKEAQRLVDIYKDYDTEMQSIAGQTVIFGNSFSPVAAQLGAVETKIKALIKEGFDPMSNELQDLKKQWENLQVGSIIEGVNKQLKDIDATTKIFGKTSTTIPDKIKTIKDAMVALVKAGKEGTLEFTKLKDLLKTYESIKPPSAWVQFTNQIKKDIPAALNALSRLSGGTNPFAQFTSGASDIASGIKSFTSGDIIGGISSAVSGIKKVIGSITGSAGKKEFKKQIAEQSAANLKVAQDQLKTYKDYAAQITAFGKSSLVSITGMAADQINMINSLDLTSHAEQVTKRIKTLLGHATGRATLWTYTFDQLGAESAKAFLERFMEIASGLSTSVGSAFSSGIKAFLGGKADWLTTLRDGIKDAIIDAITTAVLQSTIIKGALGTLLGDLASGLTAGMDVSGIIAQIGATIPIVAKQLEEVLTPLRGAVSSAFSGSIPAMADGGVVSHPTMALIGEAGPEAVVPLSQMGNMGGGYGTQEISVYLDSKLITKTVVENMPRYIRAKTGVSM